MWPGMRLYREGVRRRFSIYRTVATFRIAFLKVSSLTIWGISTTLFNDEMQLITLLG